MGELLRREGLVAARPSSRPAGAHERFHRTLKAETGQPVAGDRIAQQRRFNRFREIYNQERPHEALGQVPPASRWRPSPRSYPELLPDQPRITREARAYRVHRELSFRSRSLTALFFRRCAPGERLPAQNPSGRAAASMPPSA